MNISSNLNKAANQSPNWSKLIQFGENSVLASLQLVDQTADLF
jgi:hypothetical protein